MGEVQGSAARGAEPLQRPPLRAVEQRALDRRAVELLARFRRDERPETFRRLFELTAPKLLPVVRLLVRRHRSADDPHELLTDTFAQIFRARHTFREEDGQGFVRWFTTIAQNLLRQRHRERLRRDQRERSVARSVTDHSSNPYARLVREETVREARRTCRDLGQAVARAVERLSDRCREVVVLHTVHSLTYKEIAYRLDITASAVAMRMKRSREKIVADVLEQWENMERRESP